MHLVLLFLHLSESSLHQLQLLSDLQLEVPARKGGSTSSTFTSSSPIRGDESLCSAMLISLSFRMGNVKDGKSRKQVEFIDANLGETRRFRPGVVLRCCPSLMLTEELGAFRFPPIFTCPSWPPNPPQLRSYVSFSPSQTSQLKQPQDWTKIYTQLGLGKETVTALQAFRARHSAAMNRNAALKSTIPTIDVSHYRNTLRDHTAIGQVEKVLGDFKPVDYDLSKWNGVVEAFQGKAVCQSLPLIAGKSSL